MRSQAPDIASPPPKAALRRAALARRDGLDPAWRAEASRALARHALALPEWDLMPGGVVAGYWPIRSEADPRPLMEALAEQGRRLALPVVTPAGLVFRDWRPGEPLTDAGFGTLGPGPDAQEVQPSILIVPLAAFDRACHRIGYGAGFYDRAIARLLACLLAGGRPLLTLGLAFAVQEVARVPNEPHDLPLSLIVTETGALRPSS